MPREIKFRVWDTVCKNWMQELIVPTTYSTENSKYVGVCMPSYPITDNDKNWVNRFAFQQFTGLLDKNGVAIYEGDIIEIAEKPAPIEYIEGCFCARSSQDYPGLPIFILNKPVQVIGNIFQNPELLKS
jgi:uncharacterized phage protein (TIGR01671 family)